MRPERNIFLPGSDPFQRMADLLAGQGRPPLHRTSATLDKIARAAFSKADAETIPREQFVTFMKKYPPVLWKEKPGAAKLLQQCEGAAKEWLAAAKAKGLWSDQNKQEFLRFSKGMRGDAAGLTKESGLWSLRDLGSDG